MLERLSLRFGDTKQSFGRFLVTSMAIGFVALMVAGVASVLTIVRTQTHVTLVNHTYSVKLAINHARTLIEQGETARRGYLLTGDRSYRNNYDITAGATPRAIDRVASLTADNPRQRERMAILRPLIARLIEQRLRSLDLVGTGKRDEAIRHFTDETSARRMLRIRNVMAQMENDESALLAVRDQQQRESIQAFYGALAVAGVLLAVVALLSLATVLRYTRDLAASHDTLRDFADSLEELVAERTVELTRANEEVQRFAYIVSHDLRAPLVNVMGFTAELETATGLLTQLVDRAEAEAPHLLTEDARLAAREDLPEAIGFIRTSTQKMDRLINAILKLSRQGRRVISAETIDLAELTGTIRATVQHMLDDRGAEVRIDAPLPAIVTDRLAIEQILSNILENAIKYLDPARPGRIVVRGRREGSRALIEVEDNGRGIAAADHARIFDLFRRSGTQDQPGEGIGLAHVRALAYRLGGTIAVASELGKGTTFTVNLPMTYADPQAGNQSSPQSSQG